MPQTNINQPDLTELKERLSKNSSVILEGLCESNNATMAQVLECLPQNMWKKIDGSHFIDVMTQIPNWGKVTTIVHTNDIIMEVSGVMPTGEMGHGFYNLMGDGPLHGHLRSKRCAAIYFVERPFMGKTSASVQFINVDGGVMFKVFLGRNSDGEIIPEQLEAFRKIVDSNQQA